ncbi:unnamed protein product [Rhizopus stolonifer]
MSSTTTTRMQYVNLGKTGMKVPRFCLGCMSYGSSAWQDWVKNEEESLHLIGKAYEVGINFFDTADVYSNGESECILGKVIKKFNMPRSRIVIATKIYFVSNKENPPTGSSVDVNKKNIHDNAFGLSRKHIFDAVDASFKRLGVDCFDSETPIEETMEALNDLVRSGKVRYIGASSGPVWEFQKANAIAEKNGWTEFISMQNLYNLVYRKEDREMKPYCLDSDIATIPYAPLAQSILAGKNCKISHEETDKFRNLLFIKGDNNDDAIVDRFIEIAEKYNYSPVEIALAWMLTKPHITSPIVGCSSETQIYNTAKSLEVKLTQEDINYLKELYIPYNVSAILLKN